MWLSLLPVLLALLTKLPELIHSAEAAFSGSPGSGDAKKNFVLSAVTEAINLYQALATDHPLSDSTKSAILSTVGHVIDTTVAGFNLLGIFKSTNPLTPPATPPVKAA